MKRATGACKTLRYHSCAHRSASIGNSGPQPVSCSALVVSWLQLPGRCRAHFGPNGAAWVGVTAVPANRQEVRLLAEMTERKQNFA